jgi:membrane-bound lytic murein transglycosylase D
VPIIVAMTIMHKNARDYGLEGIEVDEPLQYESFEAEAATHLALVADAADRPVSEIRDLNPALLSGVAPSGYHVHVPAGTKTQVLAALTAIPAERRASWRIHRFDSSDTLEAVAQRYRMSVKAIVAANGVADPDAGDVLIIPTASEIERSARVKSVSRKQSSAKKTSTRGATTRSTKNERTQKSAATATRRSPSKRTGGRSVQRAALR